MLKSFKIDISGPESTGKTTLAQALCKHYNGMLVEDYSRSYFNTKELSNDFEDILAIAKKQIQLEKEAFLSKDFQFIFCDTDLINLKIWLSYYNYEIPSFLLEHINNYKSDLTLLLYPNTPWEEDALRQHKNDRIDLYAQFELQLVQHNYNFEILKKLGSKRLDQAISIINKHFKI